MVFHNSLAIIASTLTFQPQIVGLVVKCLHNR